MANIDLSAEQKVSKTKVWIMNNHEWRWLGGVVMMGDTTFTDDDHQVKTAATDGLNEFYNRTFLDQCTIEQTRFVVLHENLHKVLRHLFVWQELWKIDPQTANAATDIIINTQMLKGKAGIVFPSIKVWNKDEYADDSIWNTKTVFDDLRKNGTGGGGGHDDHMWEEAQALTPEETKEIEKQVEVAVRQAKMAGKGEANIPRNVTEMLVPEVDWKTLLSEFVKSVCSGNDKQTWQRPHKTYLAYDMYIPAPYSTTVGRILIAGDTSGSIGDKALSAFLGWMQQLCDEVNPRGVDIAWWGTRVVGVDSFEQGGTKQLASAVKPVGGGGTTPSCVPEWIKRENKNDYVCAVVITDGEFFGDEVGDWGDLPVLWLVVNDRKVKSIPVGVTVHVNELH